jgi:hypothetical protein
MKKSVIVISMVCAVLAGVLLLTALESKSRDRNESKKKNEQAATDRVTIQNGEVVIRLDASAQARNGIQIDDLRKTKHNQEFAATGLALSAQELTDLRNGYVTAQAQLVKARATLDVSRQNYERLGALYREDRNASAKAFQAAEGAFHSDEASLKAAQDALSLTENNVRQRWGDTVSVWLFNNTPQFQRLLDQRDLLIQVTLPPGAQFEPPRTALLQISQRESTPARFVSSLPRLDPRIQSPSYLYLTTKRPTLIPGMALAVRLSAGKELQGVVVPENAIVWWQGRAWAYVQQAADQFARREISTQSPMQRGWFVTSNASTIHPGDKVVVSGAQQLLSEEFRSEIQAGEEGGEDEQ